jgi:hypothetical protein
MFKLKQSHKTFNDVWRLKNGLTLSNRKSIQLRRMELGSMLIYQKGRNQFQQNEYLMLSPIQTKDIFND